MEYMLCKHLLVIWGMLGLCLTVSGLWNLMVFNYNLGLILFLTGTGLILVVCLCQHYLFRFPSPIHGGYYLQTLQQYDSLSPGRQLECEFDRDFHFRRILMNIPPPTGSDSPPPSYKSLAFTDNLDAPPPPYCTVVSNNIELTPVPVHGPLNMRQGPSNLSPIVKPKPDSSRSCEHLLSHKNDTSSSSGRGSQYRRNSQSVSDLSPSVQLNNAEKEV